MLVFTNGMNEFYVIGSSYNYCTKDINEATTFNNEDEALKARYSHFAGNPKVRIIQAS